MRISARIFWIYWMPVLIYCAAIFIQSSFPAIDSLPKFHWSDKLFHAMAYSILAVQFFRAFRYSFPEKRRSFLFLVTVMATALYGVSDEVHQYFVPTRSAETYDAMADAIGGVCGGLLYSAAFLHKRVASKPPFLK